MDLPAVNSEMGQPPGQDIQHFEGFLKFYIVALTLRIYLTWFPNINFYIQMNYKLFLIYYINFHLNLYFIKFHNH